MQVSYLIETLSPMEVRIEVRKNLALQQANQEGLEFVYDEYGQHIEMEQTVEIMRYNPLTHKVRVTNGNFTFISRLSEN